MDRELRWKTKCSLVGVCLALQLCNSTIDINKRQLQMVADSLKLDECRKLSESLHEDGFERDHTPTGKGEPTKVSCLRLLEHWNTHEGKGKTFHQLDLRLRQLGRHNIADKLSTSVSDEKVNEVRENFLDDPFKRHINTNSPLLEESPHNSVPLQETVENAEWTWFEIGEVILLIISFAFFLFILILTLLRIFLPDSFARMRVSLYHAFIGKRAGNEDLFLFM